MKSYTNLLVGDTTELTLKRVKQLKEGKIYTLFLDDQEVIALYNGLSTYDGEQVALFKEVDENEQENGYDITVFIENIKKKK